MSDNRLEPPELCRTCYWRLSGCLPEGSGGCGFYEPLFDNDEELIEEPEYDAGSDADAWGKAGFEVFDSAEVMVEYFRREE